jgi:hypothetical protein
MTDKAQQKRRTNRVFKSLHKPLTYLGVERTLFYFVCVGAVGAFNLFNSILAGVAVFIVGFAFGHWSQTVTRRSSEFWRSPSATNSGMTQLSKKSLAWRSCDVAARQGNQAMEGERGFECAHQSLWLLE